MIRSAMMGALVGAGLFFGTALVGGFGPCAPESAWKPAFDVANAPAHVVAELWPSGPVREQHKGRDCPYYDPRPWNRNAFLLTGAGVYGLFAAIAAALSRFWLADR